MDKKKVVKDIWQAGVDAVTPANFIPHNVSFDERYLYLNEQKIDRQGLNRLVLIGAGKASEAMAHAAVTALQGFEVAKAGLIITPDTPKFSECDGVTFTSGATAGKNLPTPQALAATCKMQELVDSLNEQDVVLGLWSGGGSALLTAPKPPLALDEKVTFIKAVQRRGATIEQLNYIRRHLSTVKGGQLLAGCRAQQVVSLILSDVVTNDIASIASGPTVHQPLDPATCQPLLAQLNCWDTAPEKIKQLISTAAATGSTPLPANVFNVIVASNRHAVQAMQAKAHAMRLKAKVLNTAIQGEARKVGAYLADQTQTHVAELSPGVLLAAGEPTVTISHSCGQGGRNQELSLAFMQAMSHSGSAFAFAGLFAGSDGEDGPTDAAGGLISNMMVKGGDDAALQTALAEHNAYPFLESAGALFKPGVTGTNVSDLYVIAL